VISVEAVTTIVRPAGTVGFVPVQHYGVYEMPTSAMVLLSTVVPMVSASKLFALPIMSPP